MGAAPPQPQGAEIKPKRQRWLLSWRFRIALLLSLGTASMHMMNVNMSLAIICMINRTAVDEISQPPNSFYANLSTRRNASSEPSCKDRTGSLLSPAFSGSVIWTSRTQGLIFASFSWGILAIIFTGWLSDKANSKFVIAGSVLLAAICNVLTPIAAQQVNIGAGLVIGLRTLIGLSEAMLQPSVNAFLTRWFPSRERNTVVSIVTGGRQVGTLIILPIAGQLCERIQYGGWPSIFYLCGILGTTWCGLWLLFSADKPDKHGYISVMEKRKIELALRNEKLHVKRKNRKLPWKKVLSSSAVWASVISVICHEYPVKTLAAFLPAYYQDVLRFSISKNGIFSALPVVSFLICKLGSAAIADNLQRRFRLTKSKLAKAMNSIACLGLGGFLIGVTFLGCTCPWLAVGFLSLSLGFAGLHTPGCIGTLVSIAPAYSGFITGLAYELAATSAIINAILTKEIVTSGSRAEWSLVFYVSAGVALLPLLVFNVWGSAEAQSWATQSDQPSNPSSVDCTTIVSEPATKCAK